MDNGEITALTVDEMQTKETDRREREREQTRDGTPFPIGYGEYDFEATAFDLHSENKIFEVVYSHRVMLFRLANHGRRS
ncbi:hypothetical protein M5K25_003359 [Dendrobium thyrsiflorum]|uniref:Uncharacterized protein n=1 Tax=Dendrobium thyrsiflorum TaxID=117978 RepID=A0ABD0VIR7_DENTH